MGEVIKLNPFGPDSNDITNFSKKILSIEINWFAIFDFNSNFERIKSEQDYNSLVMLNLVHENLVLSTLN